MATLAAYEVGAVPRNGFVPVPLPAVAVCERRNGYGRSAVLPSEAVLSELWAGQRFPEDALVTIDGSPVRVLHPGLRGRGAGPDFRHARVAVDGGVIHIGDVELHVRATDFRAHGHHQDARYDGVVLHVVFEDDIGADTLLSSGRRVPVVELAPWARRRTEDIGTWLERSVRWREPCHDAIERLGPQQVATRLERLGDDRFMRRVAHVRAEVTRVGRAQALCQALLESVSLGGDRAFAANLAEAVPWSRVLTLESSLQVEALLLGTAGLLSSQQQEAARHSHEIELERAWRQLGAKQCVSPSFAALRPSNHPARRLAGLAQLLAGHRDLMRQRVGETKGLDGSIGDLIQTWSVPADGYWRWNVAPARPARRPVGALIGRSRAIELLINAVLPWFAACAELGSTEGATQAHDVYAALPVPARYGRLAFLEDNFRQEGRRLRLTARRQQGLLALYKRECTDGGCGRCLLS